MGNSNRTSKTDGDVVDGIINPDQRLGRKIEGTEATLSKSQMIAREVGDNGCRSKALTSIGPEIEIPNTSERT